MPKLRQKSFSYTLVNVMYIYSYIQFQVTAMCVYTSRKICHIVFHVLSTLYLSDSCIIQSLSRHQMGLSYASLLLGF